MALATLLLATSGIAVSAVNAVVTGPANVHAARSSKSAVIGTIRAAETIKATKCRNGWCAAAGGYVRSGKLSFARAGKSERVYEGYDYNVPLALPPYGYTPGFLGLWWAALLRQVRQLHEIRAGAVFLRPRQYRADRDDPAVPSSLSACRYCVFPPKTRAKIVSTCLK